MELLLTKGEDCTLGETGPSELPASIFLASDRSTLLPRLAGGLGSTHGPVLPRRLGILSSSSASAEGSNCSAAITRVTERSASSGSGTNLPPELYITLRVNAAGEATCCCPTDSLDVLDRSYGSLFAGGRPRNRLWTLLVVLPPLGRSGLSCCCTGCDAPLSSFRRLADLGVSESGTVGSVGTCCSRSMPGISRLNESSPTTARLVVEKKSS